jgi:hypothetical protein
MAKLLVGLAALGYALHWAVKVALITSLMTVIVRRVRRGRRVA